MNAAKKGLGRGLSALFGDIEKKSESNQFQQTKKFPIADLQRNKYQPRTIFDEEKLNELSSSIKENGVIQPIAVRPTNMSLENMKLLLEREDGWLLKKQV